MWRISLLFARRSAGEGERARTYAKCALTSSAESTRSSNTEPSYSLMMVSDRSLCTSAVCVLCSDLALEVFPTTVAVELRYFEVETSTDLSR